MRSMGLGDRQWQRKARVHRLKSAKLHMQPDRRNSRDIFSSGLTRPPNTNGMRGALVREAASYQLSRIRTYAPSRVARWT
jgi:hypothetical protein